MKKKIIIIGAYGCGNKGDDAILDGMYNVFGKDFEIIPTCGRYGHLEDLLGAKIETLSCYMNEGTNFSVLWNLLKFFPRYYRMLKDVSAVIIGGGSLLHDLTKYNLPFFVILQKLAQLRNKKVFYIGVGAGPLNTQKGRLLAKKWLNKSDGIFIRECYDYNLLKDIGVSNVILSADMAFAGTMGTVKVSYLLNKLNLISGEYIVVTACQWFTSKNFWNRESMDFGKEKKQLADAIQHLIVITGKKVVFLPTVFHDYSLGMELQKTIHNGRFIVIDHNYNCREMAAIIEQSYFVFGMRMHSLIFAIRCGKPFLATVYDDKVKHLLERIEMDDYMVEFDDINSKLFDSKVYDLIKDYDKICTHLSKKSSEFRNIVIRLDGRLKQELKLLNSSNASSGGGVCR